MPGGGIPRRDLVRSVVDRIETRPRKNQEKHRRDRYTASPREEEKRNSNREEVDNDKEDVGAYVHGGSSVLRRLETFLLI